jgi:serine/threonine protein kinase
VNEAASKPIACAVGRYRLFHKIAAGGMATVHLGRLVGEAGFSRTVAIKRLLPQFAKDPEFVSRFLDEARLAARIRHPNVVSTLDVVATQGELFLVMDYVQGASLAGLQGAARRSKQRIPPRIVSAIVGQALLGLHAAHEATSDAGAPLSLVHRDVSPQNILVGIDGVARVVDFGIAKAASRAETTQDGKIKGKLSYMAPEQLCEEPVDRRTDVFAAAIVLWEGLTGERLLGGDVRQVVGKIVDGRWDPPSRRTPGLPKAVDAVVLRGLAKSPDERFPTARAMAQALEAALPPAGTLEVSEWVERVDGEALSLRRNQLAEAESLSASKMESYALPEVVVDTLSDTASSSPSSLPDASRDVPSEVAALTLIGGSAPVRRPSRRLALAGALGVAAVAAALVVAGSRPEPATTAAPISAGSTESAASAAEHRELSAPTGPAAAPTEPAAAPSATQSEPGRGAVSGTAATRAAVPTSGAGASTSAPRPARGTRAGDASKPRGDGKPRAGAKPGCDPPYVLNPDGTKRFKPECF